MEKIIQQAIERHRAALAQLAGGETETLRQMAEMLIRCIETGGCIYLCGNGGSAADAQHIAAELVGRFARERKPLPAMALTADTSLLTSVANDYGFEQVFARQVQALVKKGDILWALSTSGSSKNVLEAAKLARKIGAEIISFTGKKDSPLEKYSDLCLCIEGPTATVQEIGQLAYHIICDIVEQRFAPKNAEH